MMCINTFEREDMHHAMMVHAKKPLTRENNTFILSHVRLVNGEIREITPLVVNPNLLTDLLPECSVWLKQHVQTARRNKELKRKLAEVQAATATVPRRVKK